MDDYSLPFWIYSVAVSSFVGGAMRKISVSHSGTRSTSVAWSGALVSSERSWASAQPAVSSSLSSAVGCFAYWRSRTGPPPSSPAQGKAVVITGCDSGFGKAAAKRSDSSGFDVFATVLDSTGEGAKDSRRSCSSSLTLSQVDITQPQQVQQASSDVKAKSGSRGSWGLVNNAGVCINFGDAESSSMSNFRGCMEVNFFGTSNVTKTFSPSVRQAKGRIINISSPAGDQPFPSSAAYGSSKAALNLFAETSRHESEPWGVRVSTISPSSYKTAPSSDHSHWEKQHQHFLQNLPPASIEEYGEDYSAETKDSFQKFSQHANPDFSAVVDTIVRASSSPQPQARYYAGPGVAVLYFVRSYFPFSISEPFSKRRFSKKTSMPRASRKRSDSDGNLHNNNNNNEEKRQQS